MLIYLNGESCLDNIPGMNNLTGLTQSRMQLIPVDDDNQTADSLKMFSGDAVASKRPQLVITYYVP